MGNSKIVRLAIVSYHDIKTTSRLFIKKKCLQFISRGGCWDSQVFIVHRTAKTCKIRCKKSAQHNFVTYFRPYNTL